MEDPEVRYWIATSLIVAIVSGLAVLLAIRRRRAYWRKLRLAGNAEAKRRELQRRR